MPRKSFLDNIDDEASPNIQQNEEPQTIKQTGFKVQKSTNYSRNTINFDLIPRVRGINFTHNGKQLSIDMCLADEFPKIYNELNSQRIFSEDNLSKSDMMRILAAIGISIVKNDLNIK
ncbi:MAG: hypothetical protein ACRC0X_02010 [Brevinema sp.]